MPSSGSPSASSTAALLAQQGGSLWPWVLPAGRTWTPWGSALSHAALCSGEHPEPELSLFPSSATVLFSRMSQSPCGQSPLPAGSLLSLLSLLSCPPGGLGPMGHPEQPGHAPDSPGVPHSWGQGVRDSAPLLLSTTGEMS